MKSIHNVIRERKSLVAIIRHVIVLITNLWVSVHGKLYWRISGMKLKNNTSIQGISIIVEPVSSLAMLELVGTSPRKNVKLDPVGDGHGQACGSTEPPGVAPSLD